MLEDPVSPSTMPTKFLLEAAIKKEKEKIRNLTPNWGAMTSLYVTAEADQALILRLVSDDEDRESLVAEQGDSCARVLLILFEKVESQEYKGPILALIEDILDMNEDNVDFFLSLKAKDAKYPLEPFLSVLRAGDIALTDLYFRYAIAKIASLFLSKSKSPDEDNVKMFLDFNITALGTEKERRIPIMALKKMLTQDQFRLPFVNAGGLGKMAELMMEERRKLEAMVLWRTQESPEGPKPAAVDTQLLYEVSYCLWLVSYKKELAESKFSGISLIPNLVGIITELKEEKVQRVGLACLKNLSGSSENTVEMITGNFHNVLKAFNLRKWGDEDIEADLKVLTEVIEKDMLKLNSFDKYSGEVMSGTLLWTTPSHKSPKFWKANASHFEMNNYKILKQLGKLLDKEDDPDTVALACHDLGEFVRYHPRGKMIINKLDRVKVVIMSLMADEHPKVSTNALLAVQKMMVHNWEYLTR